MQNQRCAEEPRPPPVLGESFSHFLFICCLRICDTKKPISCLRKLNAANSTRGNFEDCYIKIYLPQKRLSSPPLVPHSPPLFCVSPFLGSELRNSRCVFHGSNGCVLTKENWAEDKGWFGLELGGEEVLGGGWNRATLDSGTGEQHPLLWRLLLR